MPAIMVVAAVWTVLVGDEGLLQRHTLKQQLLATQAQVERVRQDNERLRTQMWALRSDPAAIERAAAEQLLRARPHSVIYRFED